MKITRRQLSSIIKEALLQEAQEKGPGYIDPNDSMMAQAKGLAAIAEEVGNLMNTDMSGNISGGIGYYSPSGAFSMNPKYIMRGGFSTGQIDPDVPYVKDYRGVGLLMFLMRGQERADYWLVYGKPRGDKGQDRLHIFKATGPKHSDLVANVKPSNLVGSVPADPHTPNAKASNWDTRSAADAVFEIVNPEQQPQSQDPATPDVRQRRPIPSGREPLA